MRVVREWRKRSERDIEERVEKEEIGQRRDTGGREIEREGRERGERGKREG